MTDIVKDGIIATVTGSNITKYGSTYYIGMAMVLSIIQYIMKIQVSLSVFQFNNLDG